MPVYNLHVKLVIPKTSCWTDKSINKNQRNLDESIFNETCLRIAKTFVLNELTSLILILLLINIF